MTTTQAGSRPARLVYLASWLIAVIFAMALSSLGELLIRDMAFAPRGGPPELAQFVDHTAVDPLLAQRKTLNDQRDEAARELAATNEQLARAQQAYGASKEAFQHWIDTRKATGNSTEDTEVLGRTRALDAQLADIGRQQGVIHALEDRLNTVDARIAPISAQLDRRNAEALERYDAAAQHYALVVFGWRLCLTLPPLVLATWLVLRHRKSRYWPFVYGFAMFAAAGFFFELVPYLPSFGGYVRAGVAIVLTAFAGVTMQRAFQRYVDRKRAELDQSQRERAQGVSYDRAVTAYAKAICPSCDKPWTPRDAPVSYCVHCGLHLFVNCNCGTRNFAFFPFCSHCGTEISPGKPSVASESGER